MEQETTNIEIEVEITPRQLYQYNLYHCYRRSTSGLSGIVLGLACLVYGGTFYRSLGTANAIILVVLGIVFMIYNPVALYVRSKNRFLHNPALKKPVQYCFDDTGLTLSQGEVEETVEWTQVYRIVETGECMYVYFSRIHANLIPKAAMGERCEEIRALMRQHVPAKALKLRSN